MIKATGPLRFGLGWLLLALVLAVLLPTLALGVMATRQAVAGHRHEAEEQLRSTAQAIAFMVDRDIAGITAALAAFAASPLLRPAAMAAELPAIQLHARHLAEQLGLAVTLMARDGTLLLSTLGPPETSGPPADLIGTIEQALASGRPAIGHAALGAAGGGRIIPVAVPVPDAEGQTLLVATTSVEAERLRALLAAQTLAQGAFAAVTGAGQALLARSDGLHEALVGGTIPAEDGSAFAGRDTGLHRARAPDGTERVFGFHAVPSIPGWTVVVAQQAAALDRVWRQPLLGLALGGALALALGGLLALATARHILHPIRRLADRARAIAAGIDPMQAIPPCRIAELDLLQQGLAEAAAALRARAAAEAASAAALRASFQAARKAEMLERCVAERDRALSGAGEELRAEMRRREEAQAALLQAQKLQTLGELAGSVAHDFNNVLAAIIGSYRLIEKRTQDPALLEILRQGDRAAERATSLVRQLVDFARREELRPARVDLAALLGEVQDMVRHTVGKRLSVAVVLPPDLWPVLTDRYRLEVALLNLAANARDAMPTGGTMTISARNLPAAEHPVQLRAGDYVAIAVHDEGHGMPSEVLARITEPFFTTKPRGKGTGLGLAMVRSLAEQSGGCLRIDSAPGAGTSVEVILPRAAFAASPAGDSRPEQAEALDPGLHGRAGILLVEDDEQVRVVIAVFLRDLGYTVAEAGSAEAAEALAHSMQACDLLLTDLELPGADGATLAARLRAERPGLPVIFVTGLSPGPVLAGECVLHKPVTAPDLAGTILEQLGRRRSLRVPPPPGVRLLARLRTPSLRAAYLGWHAARLPGEAMPRLGGFDPASLDLADNAVLLAVDMAGEEPGCDVVSVGAALAGRLGRVPAGRPVEGTAAAIDFPGSLQASYRRCVRTAAPVFESARLDAGEGTPLRVEHLVLPLSEDGRVVTHLAGIVLFQDEAWKAALRVVPAG